MNQENNPFESGSTAYEPVVVSYTERDWPLVFGIAGFVFIAALIATLALTLGVLFVQNVAFHGLFGWSLITLPRAFGIVLLSAGVGGVFWVIAFFIFLFVVTFVWECQYR